MDLPLLTESDAASRLNIARRTLQALRLKGEIEYVRVGRQVRYTAKAVDDYLASRTVKATR